MKGLKPVAAGFAAAWEMLVDYHLPETLKKNFRMNVPVRYVLAAFPVVGVILGLLPVIAGKICGAVFGSFAGGAVFTLCAAVVMLGKDSGRGVSLLISYITARLQGNNAAEAAEIMSPEPGEALSSQLVTLFSTIAATAALGVLFRLGITGNYGWFTAVCAADCLIQGRLCLSVNRNSGRAFIPDDGSGVRLLAGGGILIALILLAVFHSIAALAAVVVVWIWFWRDLPGSVLYSGGTSSDAVTLGGFWCAVIVLLFGTGL